MPAPLPVRLRALSRLKIEIGLTNPAVAVIPHDEGMIKDDAAIRESPFIGKKRGLDTFDGERANPPALGLQSDAVKTTAVLSDRIPHAPSLKKGR